MKFSLLVLGACSALTLVTALPRDAHACGGCFTTTQNETAQVVTDHRMVMAIHANESILWDQIRYSGDPTEFSWVLPVAGNVTIETASSEFFEQLEASTAVRVQSPPIQTSCGGGGGGGGFSCGSASNATSADAGGGGQMETVQVLHEGTVGPYETVTLRSTDSNALANWLASHGYVIPPAVQPIVDAYVALNMDFVALRLQPGQGVKAMQPIRVRYAGANMVLPLRMVAAGASEKLGITLWVFGSGRYEAANFMNTVIDENKLVWDWDQQKSNYPEVFDLALANVGGRAFVTEYSGTSGHYGTTDDAGAASAEADWTLARGGSGYGAPYDNITRLRTSLSLAHLDADLLLQANAGNAMVSNFHQATQATGTYPGAVCGAINTGTSPEEMLAHPTRTLAGAAASVLAAVWMRRRRAARR